MNVLTRTVTLAESVPCEPVTVRRKLSVSGAPGAVKVGEAAVVDDRVTGVPAVCSQRKVSGGAPGTGSKLFEPSSDTPAVLTRTFLFSGTIAAGFWPAGGAGTNPLFDFPQAG